MKTAFNGSTLSLSLCVPVLASRFKRVMYTTTNCYTAMKMKMYP